MNSHTCPKLIKTAARWAIVAAALAAAPVARGQTTQPTVGFTPAAPSPLLGLVDSGVDADGKLNMGVNKTAILSTKDNTARFSTGQTDIAEVTMVSPTTLLVTAKKAGMTQVIVWNEKGQSQSVDINVALDITALRDEIKKRYPDAPITVDVLNGQISLRGRVPNLKVAGEVATLAAAYSKEVMNFLEVGGGQQIVVNVQFIEVSRGASNQLGFSSFFSDGGSTFGATQAPHANIYGGLMFGNPDTVIPSGATIFGSGNIGGTQFETFVQALKQNNLARTLAEPSLVSLSGEDASFLAGGQIAIPVPQAGAGGATTITIEYKEFGVRLKYNATVLGDGRIRMKMEPEVSELDYNNGTQLNGNVIPGLRTRKVSNVVEMAEGQTLALAGLLSRGVNVHTQATPLLGDLPIVGAFFRNVQYTRTETELVVLVTPHLASAMNPGQTPAAPGDRFRYPNEAQLYGLGDKGSFGDPNQPLASRHGPAPRFIGPSGFNEPAEVKPTAKADTEKAKAEVLEPTTNTNPAPADVIESPTQVIEPMKTEVVQPATAPADSN